MNESRDSTQSIHRNEEGRNGKKEETRSIAIQDGNERNRQKLTYKVCQRCMMRDV
jgi:uncharacterized protein YabE (DUF348 family)